MKKLLIYIRDYKKECILAPLFKMLEASFELIVPLVVASIIDVGISGNNEPYIIKMCAILVGLGIVGLIASITAQYYSAKAAVGFATNLRHSLFKHLLGLSFSEIDTLGTSTMITRMTSDVNEIQTGVNMLLRLFLRSPFIVFGAMIMAFTIDFNSAIIFVVAIIVLSIVVFGIMAMNIPMLKDVQKNLDKVLLSTRENLTGVRVIRAFGKEDDEIKSYNNKINSLADRQKKSGSISALMNPFTYAIINVSIVRLIWVGAIQVDSGILSQGQVIALYSYMSQILVELIKLANLIITINKSVACGNRISDVFTINSSMNYVDKIKTLASASMFRFQIKNIYDKKSLNAVEFKNVSLVYKGSKEESLSNINFSVKKGETVGILGGTGVGKSSLVNLISRFYDVSSGEVIIDGVNVKDYSQDALGKKVAVVMQKAVLFKGTIEENLKWGKKDASKDEMNNAISIAQAEDVVKSKGGLSGMLEEGGRNLSGGQRQRITIARATIKRSDILILDDSASALDFATDAKLRSAIKNLDYGVTVFIVTQRASSVQNSDKIIVLDDGKIVGIGKHDELINTCNVYKEIYYSQVKKEA